MEYQLVLQIRGESLADFDAMINLEEQLYHDLNGIAEVDGHDMGCDEINVFIFTSDPRATFEQSKAALTRLELLHDVKAAYRLVLQDTFITIWPENSKHEFSVK